jgi:hypothetical protein
VFRDRLTLSPQMAFRQKDGCQGDDNQPLDLMCRMSDVKRPRLSKYRESPSDSKMRREFATASGSPEQAQGDEDILGGGGFEILEPPDWFREMLKEGKTLTEIAEALEQRVLRGRVDLHVAKLIVNSIGRSPGGGTIVKRFLTQDLVFKLMRRASNGR